MRISGISRKRLYYALALILPALVLRLFTSLYPVVYTIYLAFFKVNPIIGVHTYAGLANFQKMASDLVVRESVFFTVFFTFLSIAFQTSLGLLVALLLNKRFILRYFARTINLIPWAIPMIVVALGFRWMFDSEYGIITDVIARITGFRFAWLIHPWGARWAIVLANVWKNTPFVAILFLAGLQSIPLELYEAARVDGASSWHCFRYITIPFLAPVVMTTVLFFTVWYLATFDIVYGMTGGGPGFSTAIMSYKIYQETFSHMNFGYASALSILLFFLVGILGIVFLLLSRRVEILL
uniref:Sugar ABC transporter permease n=1 Tax=Candidatus Caldatribacterium saccharofermentans TaxID=1454753 RepID=A0A7V4TLH3_9BACT